MEEYDIFSFLKHEFVVVTLNLHYVLSGRTLSLPLEWVSEAMGLPGAFSSKHNMLFCQCLNKEPPRIFRVPQENSLKVRGRQEARQSSDN